MYTKSVRSSRTGNSRFLRRWSGPGPGSCTRSWDTSDHPHSRSRGSPVIYLFNVASPPRSGTKWYAELFTVDHSYCYHELTQLLRPYPSNLALLDRLRGELGDHDFEQTQRRLLLQAFPQYFERLWERTYSG